MPQPKADQPRADQPRAGQPRAGADVVVVTYNPGETIGSFLGSLPGAGAVASVTVVDNDSADGSARLAAADAGAQFVDTGRNGGYGFAANMGAARGSAPWILISNADISLGEGSIDALIAQGEGSPGVGAVGPLIRETDGSTYPSARPLPGLILGSGHAVFGKVWPSNPWTRRYRLSLDAGGPALDAGWLSGACLLVRREAWQRVGGFDERFFMFFEDVDLGRRLGMAGYRNVWTPTAHVTHLGGHSYRSDPEPMLRAHHESAKLYVALAYPRWWQAPVRGLVAAALRARQRSEVAAARRTRPSLDD